MVISSRYASIAGVICGLAPDEIELLKELRLSALADAPSAFALTYEQAAAAADDDWRFLLRPEGHPTFVWEDERGIQGMAVGVQDDAVTEVVHLFAVWVRPSARAGGVADALVARVLDWAREQSTRFVRVHVTSDNERAERLYARHGFVRTGRSRLRERDGLLENEVQAAL
jgi:ribosomal protein S18 acetylase RimI-like enzyme